MKGGTGHREGEGTDLRPSSSSSADETIKSLNEQLGEPGLKSSTRVLILILLAMNKRMSSVQLRAVIGLGKGSLENHLEKLEVAGYIRVRMVRSFSGSGRRQEIEVTKKGVEDCKALLQNIHNLDV